MSWFWYDVVRPRCFGAERGSAACLHSWASTLNSPQKIVFRARIVSLATEGKAYRGIAQELGTSRPSVILWQHHFQEGGTAVLSEDASGRGHKATISAARIKQIVEATLHTKPLAATYWGVRKMAALQGVSAATVQRIWDVHGLEPHRTRNFKLSRDKQFVEKFTRDSHCEMKAPMTLFRQSPSSLAFV